MTPTEERDIEIKRRKELEMSLKMPLDNQLALEYAYKEIDSLKANLKDSKEAIKELMFLVEQEFPVKHEGHWSKGWKMGKTALEKVRG